MSTLEQKVGQIREEAMNALLGADGMDRLNEIRVAYLGKKGTLTAVLKGMKDVTPEERPKVGKWVNDAREQIEGRIEEIRARLEEEKLGPQAFPLRGPEAGGAAGSRSH